MDIIFCVILTLIALLILTFSQEVFYVYIGLLLSVGAAMFYARATLSCEDKKKLNQFEPSAPPMYGNYYG